MPNSPQATGDKIIMKDEEANELMTVTDEGKAGSVTLPPLSSIGSSSSKLYNISGNLYWSGSQLGTTGTAGGWTDDGSVIRLSTSTDKVGIGTTSPLSQLSVGGQGDNHAIISGIAPYVGSWGVYGEATAEDGRGIYGKASDRDGVGVYGEATTTFGDTYPYGVVGEANAFKGRGVMGIATNTGEDFYNYGGYFAAYGGRGRGVYAEASGIEAYAGYFNGRGYFSGNVGIGTETPSARLHLKGGSYPNSFMHFESDASEDTGFRFYEENTTKWHIFNDGANSRFEIRNNAFSPCLIIDQSSGNVGVGTTSPDGKLDVNGAIYQRGGVLHADYVFEDNYELETIEEHAEFMWENKHLKAIPKATADENGLEVVEVGSHRKGIVEELEKAHIYISQLEESIKQLTNRIEKLELKNTSK